MEPPAMTAEEVGAAENAGRIDARIWCPLERVCLFVDSEPPAGYDEPAQAVWEAAGCVGDEPDCPCARGATQETELVEQVAVTPPSAVTGPGAPTPARSGLPALRTLMADLDVPPAPVDVPLASQRPIISLSGGGMMAAAAQVDLAASVVAQAQPVQPDPDGES